MLQSSTLSPHSFMSFGPPLPNHSSPLVQTSCITIWNMNHIYQTIWNMNGRTVPQCPLRAREGKIRGNVLLMLSSVYKMKVALKIPQEVYSQIQNQELWQIEKEIRFLTGPQLFCSLFLPDFFLPDPYAKIAKFLKDFALGPKCNVGAMVSEQIQLILMIFWPRSIWSIILFHDKMI